MTKIKFINNTDIPHLENPFDQVTANPETNIPQFVKELTKYTLRYDESIVSNINITFDHEDYIIEVTFTR